MTQQPEQATRTGYRAPTHGFTRRGWAVHARTLDHLPTDTAYARLNKKLALALTNYVGTMPCF